MKIFVLIVATHVNSGGVVTFQEFFNENACERARTVILSSKAAKDIELLVCTPKKL